MIMNQTKTQRFMLYSLGKWFEEANEKNKRQTIKDSISKSLFVDFVLNSKVAEKKERAIYKNLETLEEKKLIQYDNKEIELTEKGIKFYEKIKSDIDPYVTVQKKLQKKIRLLILEKRRQL
jgi:coproporphyrinogen III oxidase-like Fe-S oxidoreductase